jgi:hypothetical protein
MGEITNIPCEKYENGCKVREGYNVPDCNGIIYSESALGFTVYRCASGCGLVERMNQRQKLIQRLEGVRLI